MHILYAFVAVLKDSRFRETNGVTNGGTNVGKKGPGHSGAFRGTPAPFPAYWLWTTSRSPGEAGPAGGQTCGKADWRKGRLGALKARGPLQRLFRRTEA